MQLRSHSFASFISLRRLLFASALPIGLAVAATSITGCSAKAADEPPCPSTLSLDWFVRDDAAHDPHVAGEYLYYLSYSQLLRVPLAGGATTKVVEGSVYAYWVTEDGVLTTGSRSFEDVPESPDAPFDWKFQVTWTPTSEATPRITFALKEFPLVGYEGIDRFSAFDGHKLYWSSWPERRQIFETDIDHKTTRLFHAARSHVDRFVLAGGALVYQTGVSPSLLVAVPLAGGAEKTVGEFFHAELLAGEADGATYTLGSNSADREEQSLIRLGPDGSVSWSTIPGATDIDPQATSSASRHVFLAMVGELGVERRELLSMIDRKTGELTRIGCVGPAFVTASLTTDGENAYVGLLGHTESGIARVKLRAPEPR
jgi:hypothetical protein